MATNNIKPFATDSSANVLTDTALASRSELQTGFPLKSKADSALIGKLMQNATAGAYAVGQFSAKYSTTDITGSDATGFATAFESALESYIDEKAPTPDLNPYLTKAEASTTYQLAGDYATVTQLNLKADASALANYAPLANPALTGTATLNGQNVATVNQIPDTSHFVTDTTIQGYAPLAGAAFTGAVTVQEPTAASNPATKQYVDSAVSSVLKYKGTVASESALPQSDQAIGDVWTTQDSNKEFAWDGTKWIELGPTIDLSGYLTTESASATYLSKTDAQSTYQPVGDYATNTALATKADASALANYAPLANPAFTGTATLGGQTIATVNQIPDTSAFITSTPSANLVTAPAGITIDSEKQLAGISVAAGASIVRLSEENAEILGSSGIKIASPNTRIGDDNEYALSLADSSGIIFTQNNQTLLSIVQGTITTHSLQDESVINNLSERLVLAEGSRGYLAGYESIAINNRGTLTVNQDSTESLQVTTATTITVSDGSPNTAWVKKVSIKHSGVIILLGSAWTWVGGSQPTVTAPSLLVLSWDNDCGMAILNTTG